MSRIAGVRQRCGGGAARLFTEIGLAGSDDLSIKVSPDSSSRRDDSSGVNKTMLSTSGGDNADARRRGSGYATVLNVEASGRIGIKVTCATTPLDVDGDTIRLRQSRALDSASATGNVGDIAWDANYF